jgi:hypothetical protein
MARSEAGFDVAFRVVGGKTRPKRARRLVEHVRPHQSSDGGRPAADDPRQRGEAPTECRAENRPQHAPPMKLHLFFIVIGSAGVNHGAPARVDMISRRLYPYIIFFGEITPRMRTILAEEQL